MAQDRPGAGFADALREIREGGKRTHWIWYIFPQLSGLGSSPASRAYGLAGVAEAAEYLRDPVLRARLLEITRAVADHLRGPKGPALDAIMGSEIDALKLVSSLTLFAHVARRLHENEALDEYVAVAAAADEILGVAQSQGYPPCAFTRRAIASGRRDE